MRAMILAAGYGSRLRPLTDSCPKALLTVSGRPLLSIVLDRLVEAGCTEVAINVHHHAPLIMAFLSQRRWPNLKIMISVEERLLDTGGALVRMMDLMAGDAPVLVHNVDVLTDLDLVKLLKDHHRRCAEVTLAVQARPTSRPLVFDDQLQLLGRPNTRPVGLESTRHRAFAFNGIHVFNPQVLRGIAPHAFSSIDHYIRLAQQGRPVLGFVMEGWYWRDLGKPEDLEQAETDIRCGKITFPTTSADA
ncbi:MAG TPA: nucleotidyltransferase family protein [bacterium]|nr:nucleotidyltransferase family protein [bacterium]HPN33179.1 nucleotidyltransferase family protein [bacterium]